jgi:transposase InsO family protein
MAGLGQSRPVAVTRQTEAMQCAVQSRQQTREVVFEFIEAYYNRIRRHSHNGWLSPV